MITACLLIKKCDQCRYFVSWEPMSSEKYKTIHNYTLLITFFMMFITAFLVSFSSLIQLAGLLAVIHLGFRLYINHLENQELRSIISNQSNIESTAYKELIEQIDRTYQSYDMLRKISIGISKPHQLNETLQEVINVLKGRYDRCAILLANSDQSKLIYRVGFGYTKKQLNLWQKTGWFHVLDSSQGTFIRTYRENRSFLINDIKDVINDFSIRSNEFAKKMGVKSLISCPIYYQNQPFGILAVDNYLDQRELIQSDINLLMGIANQIGIYIQYNKKAIKERQAAMVGLAQQAIHNIRSPASSIDVDLRTLTDFCQLDNNTIEIIKDIKRQNSRILELSNNFLRYLKPIEERKEKFQINKFLQEIISHMSDKQISLSLDPSDPTINADPDDFKWIFEELIENTKKYAKFPVEIETKLLVVDDSREINEHKPIVEISFHDNGEKFH
ncbi:MAG: hypothetical protein OMM_12173, partial [Candidatus Magnetoglobus multicellularis str. Araruama]